jgi:hypothetical protein
MNPNRADKLVFGAKGGSTGISLGFVGFKAKVVALRANKRVWWGCTLYLSVMSSVILVLLYFGSTLFFS